MVKIDVELLAPFAQMADNNKFALSFEAETTLGHVVRAIEERVGPEFTSRLLTKDKQINPGITILKDGININREDILNHTIGSCSLVFCILVSGG